MNIIISIYVEALHQVVESLDEKNWCMWQNKKSPVFNGHDISQVLALSALIETKMTLMLKNIASLLFQCDCI